MGNTYEQFWEDIFQSYVHRKNPKSANEDPKTNYDSTLRLLTTYKSILEPDEKFWTVFDTEDYTYNYEYSNFVHIDLLTLNSLSFKGINPKAITHSEKMLNSERLK